MVQVCPFAPFAAERWNVRSFWLQSDESSSRYADRAGRASLSGPALALEAFNDKLDFVFQLLSEIPLSSARFSGAALPVQHLLVDFVELGFVLAKLNLFGADQLDGRGLFGGLIVLPDHRAPFLPSPLAILMRASFVGVRWPEKAIAIDHPVMLSAQFFCACAILSDRCIFICGGTPRLFGGAQRFALPPSQRTLPFAHVSLLHNVTSPA